MGRASQLLALLLCLLAPLAASAQQEVAVQPPLCQRLNDAGPFYHAAYLCVGVPPWALFPALWTPLSVQVNCTAPTYEIFTAESWEDLQAAPQPVRWCGFAHFAAPDTCAFTLSPFQDVFVAIRTKRSSLLHMIGNVVPTPEPQCTFAARRDLSLAKVAMTVLGVALFTNARTLTASTTFRLGAGALTFASGAALVVVFILMRSVPHKKKLAAALAFSASSVVATLRWAYGTWSPDLVGILTSRAAVTYFLVTGLLGLAVTYWLDDPGNVKINTTVSAVLHLAGLLLVFLGTTSEPASLAIIALLVASRVLAPVLRRAPAALQAVQGALALVAGTAAAVAGAAFAAAAAKAQRIKPAKKAAAGIAAPARRPAAAASRRQPVSARHGLLLSEDEEREAALEARRLRREEEARRLRAEELLRAQQQREAQQQQQQQLGGWRWPSPERPASPPVVRQQQPPGRQQAAARETGSAPSFGGWFTRWSGGGSSEPAPAARGVPAAAAPPPAAAPAVAAKPAARATREVSPQKLRSPPTAAAGAAAAKQPAAATGRARAPAAAKQQKPLGRKGGGLIFEADSSGEEASDEDASGGPQPSPWSQERLVVDILSPRQQQARSRAAAGASSAAAPVRTPPAGAAGRSGAGSRTPRAAAAAVTSDGEGGAAGGGGDVSPLVAMGKIFSAESGRVIQIGKGKYEELLAKGYTPDFKAGVLHPPGGGGADSGGGATPKRAARGGRRG